ncbi:MAG: methionyl-tRNA formyltransferase [Planctomycetaceae bacterium]|nr:methionyl-tRNA formyltransferase [Planctomycetaceae bacterium]
MSLKLLMMGTGTFALPTFLRLCDSPHDVVGLVTQPDRTGRGHHQHVNEMKQAAEARGIVVFQPDSANQADSLERLRDFDADLFVVAAYGQILSARLLRTPPLGAINVHASLLPKYRGAAPIVYALLNGEAETGVSIFRIEPKLDAGPVLGMRSTEIRPKETAGELELRLAELAPELTLNVIDQLDAGTATGVVQDAQQVTTAPKLRKEQGEIDWSQSSHRVECQILAMQPWPKPYTLLHAAGGKTVRILILDVDPVDDSVEEAPPGSLLSVDGVDGLVVRTGSGAVRVNRLQPEGKRVMSSAEFLRGHQLFPGQWFGGLPSGTADADRV